MYVQLEGKEANENFMGELESSLGLWILPIAKFVFFLLNPKDSLTVSKTYA